MKQLTYEKLLTCTASENPGNNNKKGNNLIPTALNSNVKDTVKDPVLKDAVLKDAVFIDAICQAYHLITRTSSGKVIIYFNGKIKKIFATRGKLYSIPTDKVMFYILDAPQKHLTRVLWSEEDDLLLTDIQLENSAFPFLGDRTSIYFDFAPIDETRLMIANTENLYIYDGCKLTNHFVFSYRDITAVKVLSSTEFIICTPQLAKYRLVLATPEHKSDRNVILDVFGNKALLQIEKPDKTVKMLKFNEHFIAFSNCRNITVCELPTFKDVFIKEFANEEKKFNLIYKFLFVYTTDTVRIWDVEDDAFITNKYIEPIIDIVAIGAGEITVITEKSITVYPSVMEFVTSVV